MDVDQIEQARRSRRPHRVGADQFSPAFRSSLPELRACADLGIAFLPYSRSAASRTPGGLGGANAAFQRIADDRGVSAQQVALAWELSTRSGRHPDPRACRPETIRDSAAAAELQLTEEELASLAE